VNPILREEAVPDAAAILAWIEHIYAEGVRRPGYPADRFAESFCADRFREFGLENVRLEPVRLPYWEPRSASLRVNAGSEAFELPCFPLPHAAPVDALEAELAGFDPTSPAAVKGKASLYEVPLLRVPPAWPALQRDGVADPASAESAKDRIYDPRGSFDDALQVLPFGPQFQNVMEPSIEAGALAFVGVLSGYPGDSYQYYVPYDGIARAIPGVWIRDSDGRRLRAHLEKGRVRVALRVDSVREEVTCHNVLGELPGADDDSIVIGSHHDGPWSSAVEDASGIALVLAQCRYWARLRRAERPHRLVFLLNAGHMVGGAGCRAFLESHATELARIVLEIHLEHAAREFTLRDDALAPTGLPETRWFFTSRIPSLERAVRSAIEAEQLERSLILPPDVFGPHPTTDGGFFHVHDVPLVNYLTAPFYLFDAMDTLDKIDVPSLVPVTRATIRILESTRGISAAEMRSAGVRTDVCTDPRGGR
jgi:hypothetical protein